MKLRFAVFTTLLMFAIALNAGSNHKATITFAKATLVAGTTLTPGDYTIRWSGSGSNVPLTFMQGKNTLVTAVARTVDQYSGLGIPQIRCTDKGDSIRALLAIVLPKVTLELQGDSGTAAAR